MSDLWSVSTHRHRPRVGPRAVVLGELSRQVVVECGEELLGREPGSVAATVALLSRAHEQRQVLGHLAALDGVDADLLEGLGELRDLRSAVEHPTMLQATRPGEDRRDRVGRRLLTSLVL